MTTLLKPVLLSLTLGLGLALPGVVFSADNTSVASAGTAVVASPEIIQILSVDGEEQPGALFGSRSLSLKLTPGEHVVSVRYNQLFQLGADEHDIVKSSPVAFRFTAAAGGKYRFETTPPKRHEAARQFAKNPDIRLVNEITGERITGIVVKSLGQASLVDTMSKAFQSAQGEAAANGTERLEALKTLWLNASPSERQAFAAWLAAQAAGK